MERYDNLGLVGEGSYGMVLRCRHKETSQIVAIKKFIESEEDKMVKKIAMREIRMLKQLRHENLVNLLEVFRRKKRLFLVFEFVERTVLDDLEKRPEGLEEIDVKKISFQVLRGLDFCHNHNVIHRDVKPENILISNTGVVKLCDFGFARTLATGPGEVFTDYVATRWYRAPELLVGDINYGKAVDIWAVGCLLFEMITGDPLFPGDSDIDQLFHIVKHLGNLTQHHQEIFHRNPLFTGMRLPSVKKFESFERKFPKISRDLMDLIVQALMLDASKRPTSLAMMKHQFFQYANFAVIFLEELKEKIEKETISNPFLKSLAATKERNYKNKSSTDLNNKKEHSPNKENQKKKEKDMKRTPPKTSFDQKSLKEIPKQYSQSTIPSLFPHEKETSSDNGKLQRNSREVAELSSDKHLGKYVDSFESERRDYLSNQKKSPRNAISNEDCIQSFPSQLDREKAFRTPLDLSISMPGKNLPELNNMTRGAAHGHDVIKQKKGHHKKTSSRIDQLSSICAVIDKVPIHMDRNKSTDDSSFLEKQRRKDTRREAEDFLYQLSNLTLPSVKGATESKTHKNISQRDSQKRAQVPAIPHIQNLDPFSQSSETGNGTGKKSDGNLPAV